MRRVILGGLLLATLSLAGAAPAVAAVNYNGSGIAQRVKLQGFMPLTRVIYINQQNQVISVVGNTSQNITPVVTHQDSGDQLAMTASVKQQYQDILSANGGSLKAGVTYRPISGNVLKMSVN